jgi:cytochrome c oxidase assembly protein subunit 15
MASAPVRPTDKPGPHDASLRRRRLSPARYRSITVAAFASLCFIVVTGAAVRLTGSGLGCDDWPNCNNERLIDVSSTHAAIEQVNRLITGVVAICVILAVLGSLLRAPRRRDLTWLSVGLVAGVIGQIVLGGITVLVDLHPAAVQGHFLLSMVLCANAVVLVHRAGLPDGPVVPVVTAPTRRYVGVVTFATAVVLVLGTIVTGAGPHAGDEEARRYGFDIGTVVQVHSVSVWVSVAIVAALVYRLRARADDRARLDAPVTAWFAVAFLQGGVGYLQYFSGVPATLVGVHVAGATALWSVTVWMWAATRSRLDVSAETGGDGPELTDRLLHDLADGEHVVDAPGDLARQGE